MRIWKLYNHGFFVRTPTVSYAIDIVPGTAAQGFSVDLQLLERLADQADALFISHLHGDHASQLVARLFLARKKPVVAPEGLWAADAELSRALLYPQRSAAAVHEIPVQAGRNVLKVVAYPGHQGSSPIVNVNLIASPEGLTVLHTGDQSGEEGPGGDFDWIAQIGARRAVDVLLPNCWTTNIQRLARGVNPKLILTGHENEMGHTVDHREDYTQTYNHLFKIQYPFIVMGWGESYHYLGRRD
jgi:L-ascorbate metabolism protein UlaG (beta-lactamase superfamily)